MCRKGTKILKRVQALCAQWHTGRLWPVGPFVNDREGRWRGPLAQMVTNGGQKTLFYWPGDSGAREMITKKSESRLRTCFNSHTDSPRQSGSKVPQIPSCSSVKIAANLPPNWKCVMAHNKALKIFGASSSSMSDNGSAGSSHIVSTKLLEISR